MEKKVMGIAIEVLRGEKDEDARQDVLEQMLKVKLPKDETGLRAYVRLVVQRKLRAAKCGPVVCRLRRTFLSVLGRGSCGNGVSFNPRIEDLKVPSISGVFRLWKRGSGFLIRADRQKLFDWSDALVSSNPFAVFNCWGFAFVAAKAAGFTQKELSCPWMDWIVDCNEHFAFVEGDKRGEILDLFTVKHFREGFKMLQKLLCGEEYRGISKESGKSTGTVFNRVKLAASMLKNRGFSIDDVLAAKSWL